MLLTRTDYDTLIVGAGISGIGTAYWLKRKCPGKSFAILEAREQIGGTWSLFKYPGIRSDSDMFTFGYRFKPWLDDQSMSNGDKILAYLEETVEENQLQEYIRYNHKMISANWSDQDRLWEIAVETPSGSRVINCQFLSICTGYYDYHEAHRPRFQGEDQFLGKIIVPQFWPEDLSVKEKKVVVVGSGATAVTLVPALVDHGAEHVTMLQRSPTYIMNLPNRNQLFIFLKKVLPDHWAYRLTRWQNIGLQMLSFGMSKVFPGFMKSLIIKDAAKQLPKDFEVSKHFHPTYNPWDQRLCVVPDGDLFRTISSGKADVVTDEIIRFEKDGLHTVSGGSLEADIVVLATGLKMQLLGGASVTVNGKPFEVNEAMVYKGMMISDLPNFIYAFGYTNASWTLKVDLTANYLCKLINKMERKGYDTVIPTRPPEASEENFLNLSSGYIQRARTILPKQGKRRPWKVVQNYLVDMLSTRFDRLNDSALTFRKVS